jgi:predicted nucleotide-binding protein
MVGSHRLAWPDDPREELGLTWLLVQQLAADPQRALHFGHTYFAGGSSSLIHSLHELNRQLIVPFARDYKAYVTGRGRPQAGVTKVAKSNRIFIVHGHDVAARESVARFVMKLNLDPIILHEQANQGRTVIEKVEAHSDAGFAIVLLTPDDEGRAQGAEVLEPRARQNVLLELGYFIAKLGRSNVCALRRRKVEIPSDFAGVVWTDMDEAGAWRTQLGKELQAAGYRIDWNQVMGS